MKTIGGNISGKATVKGLTDHSGIMILAENKTIVKTYSVNTDTSGDFIIESMKAGTYLLRASKVGYSTKTIDNVVVEVGGNIENIVFPELTVSTGTITGKITLEGAASFEGIQVLANNTAVANLSYNTITDAQGIFILSDVKPGKYLLLISKDGYITNNSEQAEILSDEIKVCSDIILKSSSGKISGTITLESSEDFSGIDILAINDVTPDQTYSTVTDTTGYFVVGGVKAGNYRIQASKGGYNSKLTDVFSVSSGGEYSSVALNLLVSSRSVIGKVLLEGMTDFAGIKITATNINSTSSIYSALSNSEGFYVIAGMVPGEYIVGYSRENYKSHTSASISLLADSSLTLPDVTLEKARGNITGIAKLEGKTDSSGIKAILVGTTFETTTDINGAYALVHVPLGAYTLAFERLNTPKVTTTLNVVPSDSIVIAKLDMIPNSSSVEGYVKLTGMTNFGNINVSITTESAATLSTLTNASGYFYIGNILSTGSHRVTFSKAGWNDVTMDINDFVPLEVREVGVSPEIILVDTTAPVFSTNGVVINSGANMTDNSLVNILIDSSDYGSGINMMQISFNGIFDVAWEPYFPSFTRELIGSGNGDRTVYIKLKDLSGNISDITSDSITFTNQFKTYEGVLTDLELHWIKSDGIVLLTDNVLVEIGKTLIIDPGVEVRVDPGFYLKIQGAIVARGTPDEKIIFTSSNDVKTKGDWSKIWFNNATPVVFDSNENYISGSIMEYCNIEFAVEGVLLNGVSVIIDNCNITNNTNSGISISGNSNTNSLIRNCIIDNNSSGISITGETVFKFSKIYNNIIRNCENGFISVDVDELGDNQIIDNDIYYNTNGINISNYWRDNINNNKIVNNKIHNNDNGFILAGRVYNTKVYNNNIYDNVNGILVNKINIYDPLYTDLKNNVINNNINIGIKIDMEINSGVVNFNNIYSNGSNYQTIVNNTITNKDFQYNYWGPSTLAEMNTYGENYNIGAIFDYYDNFEKGKIIYKNWSNTEWPNAGYRGASYVGFDFTLTGNAAPVTTTDLTIDFTINTTNAISSMRISDSLADLLVKSYTAYSASTQYLFNTAKIVDNYVTIYIQLKDRNGNESGIISKKILCNIP